MIPDLVYQFQMIYYEVIERKRGRTNGCWTWVNGMGIKNECPISIWLMFNQDLGPFLF